MSATTYYFGWTFTHFTCQICNSKRILYFNVIFWLKTFSFLCIYILVKKYDINYHVLLDQVSSCCYRDGAGTFYLSAIHQGEPQSQVGSSCIIAKVTCASLIMQCLWGLVGFMLHIYIFEKIMQ